MRTAALFFAAVCIAAVDLDMTAELRKLNDTLQHILGVMKAAPPPQQQRGFTPTATEV